MRDAHDAKRVLLQPNYGAGVFWKKAMIFSRDYVGYLARQTVKHLVDAKMIETAKAAVLNERVAAAMVDELALEDRINEEVRVILDAFQEDMLQDRRQLSGDVQESEERAGAQVQGGAVRISSDK
jgi:hypothetical protein